MASDGPIEKPRFDVYAMMLVLSFVMTLGASLILNEELSSNWGFKLFGEAPKPQDWHITEWKDLKKIYNPNSPYIDIRDSDIKEWKAISAKDAKDGKPSEFPVKDFEWPVSPDTKAPYRVDQYPVDPSNPNNWESVQPRAGDDEATAAKKKATLEQFKILLDTMPKDASKEPAPAPETPPKPDATATPPDAAKPGEATPPK